MIKSFHDRQTEQIFRRESVARLQLAVQRAAQRKLDMIDAAERIDDLRIPRGNRLEKLTGDRKGQYSIRVNDQWRICFVWSAGDALRVELADYH